MLPARHNTTIGSMPPAMLPAALQQAAYTLIHKDGQQPPPLAPAYNGPYRVMQRSLHTFQLQVGTKVEVVSIFLLTAACMPAGAPPALLPRRGCPPIL